jgi:hypothetical protein
VTDRGAVSDSQLRVRQRLGRARLKHPGGPPAPSMVTTQPARKFTMRLRRRRS